MIAYSRKNLSVLREPRRAFLYSLVIIDDEEYVTVSLPKYISAQHTQFQVAATFTSAGEALTYLHAHGADVVITDIRMPHMDGLEMLAELREFLPDADVLILSGYSEFEYARKACTFGVRNYLLKPIDFQELSKELDSIAALRSKSAPPPVKEQSAPAPRVVSNIGVEDDSVIQYAKNYIRSHYADNISRDTVAKVVFLDGAYFSRLFKQKTGQSYIDFLTEVRMEKAKELLATHSSISEISEAVGYFHRNQFITNFRKFTGYTPNEYRTKVLLEADRS